MFTKNLPLISILAVVLAAIALAVSSASAGKYTLVPDGDVTALKAAISSQNTVELSANGFYTLIGVDNSLAFGDNNGLPVIATGRSVTINGNGATIARSNAITTTFRLFYIEPGATLTLTNIILANGNAGAFYGGGVLNNAGNLYVRYSKFTGNQSAGGGAIATTGLGESVTTIVFASTFISNSTPLTGGALLAFARGNDIGATGNVTSSVSSSTFTNNLAQDGGAIANYVQNGQNGSYGVATSEVSNSTFKDNLATRAGGALVNLNYATASISNSATLKSTNNSFQFNQAQTGGGVANVPAAFGQTTAQLRNNLFSFDTGGNCYGTFTGGIKNLEHNNGGGLLPATCGTGTLVSPHNPFDEYGDNGGFTFTYSLSPDSEAFNAGDNATCAAAPVNGLDQRGLTRPAGSTCDIGSFEKGASFVVTQSQDDGMTFTPGSLSNGLRSVPQGGTINFAAGITTVDVTGGPLPALKQHVTLAAACTLAGGPSITINGNNTPYAGLRLSGDNVLTGLIVRNFGLQEIVTLGNGNTLTCMNAKSQF